ncbi:MAG: FIST C-terminal domain-containing protein [Hydrogenophilus sp.]|nr:FIST C-terminal domain-containing protein [Hydrogenophilus sp.]
MEQTRSEEVKGIVLFLAEGNGWDDRQLTQWATAQRFPVAGGIFPRVIAKGKILTEGGVVVGWPRPLELHRVAMTEKPLLPEALREASPGTVFVVLIDGLSPYVRPLIETLYDELGIELRYIGGGAGSLTLRQQPCLVTPEGVVQGEALLISLGSRAAIAVRHGWQPLSKELIFEATESEGNTVVSFDWEPALSVYRRFVEPRAGVAISSENFFSVAQAYPLGLVRPSGEFVVRDPIRIEGERLVCVGPVPAGSTVTILQGNPEMLLAAAEGVTHAAQSAASFPVQGRLVFDCISRALFLRGQFGEELARLIPDDLPTAGALTLGEIAFTQREGLQFYNKTAVVGLVG